MQDADGALAAYTALIAQQPDSYALHANRAAAQLALGRWEEAVEDCDAAARLLLGELGMAGRCLAGLNNSLCTLLVRLMEYYWARIVESARCLHPWGDDDSQPSFTRRHACRWVAKGR